MSVTLRTPSLSKVGDGLWKVCEYLTLLTATRTRHPGLEATLFLTKTNQPVPAEVT
jgi:hypothetical protein